MDRVKVRTPKATTTTTTAATTASPAEVRHPVPPPPTHLCDRREKLHQRRKSPRPVLHPDVVHAQSEGKGGGLYRYSEDCRPMFSPIPRNSSSEGEDSPRGFGSKSSSSKEKTSFPAIHVEKCEKSQASYAESCSPDLPVSRSPESDMDMETEVMTTSQGSGSGSGGLNVPSPFLQRQADGRVVLVTRASHLGGSWSRSEGNLPEAVQRSANISSSSAPGSQSHLLDIRYRPDWLPRPTLRQSSDVALHERRRAGQGSPTSPRRLTTRHDPLPRLSKDQRALSANSLQSP